MTKTLTAAVLILLSLVACQASQVGVGVACAETQGTTDLMHLGQAEVGEGFPYTINVYLPPCYEIEAEREYPILYLFPGRGSGPTTWFDAGVTGVADQMIRDEEIPPLIMVALENVEGDLLAENFTNNVFPYVEGRFRILDGARYHAIGGGSMGGAPSYRMAFRYPELFSSAALFGSGIILGEEGQVREWLDAIPAWRLPRVFLNTGFQDDLLMPRAEEFKDIVSEFGIEPYTVFSEGGHNYPYWVSNFPVYLRWLAEGWQEFSILL
ncbi:MAG: alpha/beta hydrolase-fold protein [Anaerolineales bacterium]